MKKTHEEAIEILNELTEDANQWVVENSERKKTVGVHQVDTYSTFLNAWQQNNVRGQGQTLQGYQNHQRQQYQPQEGQHGNQSSLEEVFKSFIPKVDERFEIQGISIRNLEKQVGQIANQISERPTGNLPILRYAKTTCEIPFTEVIHQMPAYAKFLKELADQSTIIPEGIVEDVVVRVDKFVFPVDFIVVNMEENKEVPLILGRPFLATGRAILDVYEAKLMLRVGEEKVVFNMKKVDELIFKETKSDKKIIAWVCALGQSCTRETDIISDTN
ncbi:hypothetical protein R3W88_000892 [Solanum pinnatisectum]|uniref:Reverse transcriptase domain-containing protein n=1 Tax=Solanum pinnatisectum TaxID=50273 RepID=A0AAV9MK21_9SOLN|nr:hypothetical protein R3W88_000892 [Solanum pinnatisectum]